MTYLALNLSFILASFVILNVLVRKTAWKVVLQTLLVMFFVTLICDNIIIALGIVAYDTSKVSGWFLGLAPIEDFAYTVVAVLAVASIWQKLKGGKK